MQLRYFQSKVLCN